MITHPSAAEIAKAVASWIDSIRPQLDARNAYLARVAVNGLAIIGRELDQCATEEQAIADQLASLLHETGRYDALVGKLCEQLRGGQLNIDSPQLLSILRADALSKLAIDQPNYHHETSNEQS